MDNLKENTCRERILKSCNYCKTLMMLIVVAFHSLGFWGIKNWYSISPLNTNLNAKIICNWMSSFHVHTFVFVSGFLFFELKIRYKRYNCFWEFILKKVKRLLIPYVLVSIFWCIPIGNLFFHYSLVEIIKKYFLGIAPSQLWFLLMLFWIYGIAWLIVEYIYLNRRYWATFIIVILFLVSIFFRQYIPNVFMIWKSFEFLPIFWVGFLVNEQCETITSSKVTLFGICHMLLFGILEKLSINNVYIESILQLIMNICGSTFIFLLIVCINGKSNKNLYLKKIISNLGKYSMAIYLFHQQIIYICLRIVYKFPIGLGVMINISFSIIGSIIISKVLRKNKITLYILGEKN